MESPERAEARQVAAALIGFVIDNDQESAEVLLGDTSHQVIAQAATDLARWIVSSVEGDMAEFREGLAEQLRRLAAGEP